MRLRRRHRLAWLVLLLCLLAPPVHAQQHWSYVVWESPTPVTAPRQVEVWGEGVAVFGDYIGEDLQHGTVNFYFTRRCWVITLRSGSLYRVWWERSACAVYYFPMVGIASPP